MILTYLHLSRHAECNGLALAVSQGIIKCDEVWNIGVRKCLVKGTHGRTSAFPFGFPRPRSLQHSASEVCSQNVPPQEILQIKLHGVH